MSNKPYQSILFILLLLFTTANLFAQIEPASSHSRMAYTDKTGGFITDWLIVGGFRSDDNFGTDFLISAGGESKIQPSDGMQIKGETGAPFTWKSYSSRYNYINFFDALDGQNFTSSTIYAYAEVNSQEKKESVLSFGIMGSSKVWLNGDLVYSGAEYSSSKYENTQVKVNLKKGENKILIKSASGGWTSGFCFRIIDPNNFSSADNFILTPQIVNEKSSDNSLVIKTDRTLNPFIQQDNVNVKVRKAGGKIVEEVDAKRSEEIIINTEDWDEGVYDFCFSCKDNKNELMTAYILWYKGNPLAEIQELIESIPEKIETQSDIVINMLKDMKFDRLGVDDLTKADPANYSKIYSPLMEYEELMLEKNGETALARDNGFIRFAWYDPIDNTPQFLRVFLPINYDQNKKYPLMLKLHGYNGENPKYIKWWDIDKRHWNNLDKHNIIFAEPHGRGNTSYEGMGEQDVIRGVETIVKNLSVAQDSIYLYGESMGGGGTWYVGSRHPGLFAAIAPVYGGWDYRTDMSKEDIAKLSPRQKFANEKSSSFAQADALLTTPIIVSHGDIDRSVDVRYSRFAVGMMQRWGYNIKYHEHPGFGHEGINPYDEVIPWLKQFSLNNNPAEVRVRAAELLTAKAHWVKITQRFDPFEFVSADVEVMKNNTLRLTTENVAEIILSPKDPLIDPAKEISIIWNASDLRKVKMTDGEIVLRDKNYKPSEFIKTPQIEGPVSMVTNTPFAVVIGTISKDPNMVKVCEQKANEFIGYWKNWQKFEPRVFKDTEITDEDIAAYSLLLYGGPSENLVAQKMQDKLPLKIMKDKVVITGKEFEAKDAAVKFVYPNPFNPKRYVLVLAGTSTAGLFLLNNENTDFDFSISDGCIANERKGRSSDKIIIARGIFDYNWQIDEKYTEYGDQEVRAKAPFKTVDENLNIKFINIPNFDVKKYASYVGNYAIAPGINVGVYKDGENLMGKSPDGNSFVLVPDSENVFIIPGENVQITFVEEDGKITSLIVVQPNQNEMTAKKVD